MLAICSYMGLHRRRCVGGSSCMNMFMLLWLQHLREVELKEGQEHVVDSKTVGK